MVKGEVGCCDLVALKGDDPPVVVIGELKLIFDLELVLQGVDRSAACDEVWLAARLSSRGKGRESDVRFRNLCRKLGFGLLGVLPNSEIEVLISPTAPLPRKNRRRRSRLVEEHRRRRGDPVEGGGSRTPIMTAYRQRALACAAALAQGPRRPRDLKASIPMLPEFFMAMSMAGSLRSSEESTVCPSRSDRASALAAIDLTKLVWIWFPAGLCPRLQHHDALAFGQNYLPEPDHALGPWRPDELRTPPGRPCSQSCPETLCGIA